MRTALFLLLIIAVTTAAACSKDEPKGTQPSATTASPIAASSAPSITGIADCDDYLKAVDKYLACPDVAQVLKDDTVRGRKNLEARWTNAGEDRQAVAKACAVAAKATRANTHAGGCDAAP